MNNQIELITFVMFYPPVNISEFKNDKIPENELY